MLPTPGSLAPPTAFDPNPVNPDGTYLSSPDEPQPMPLKDEGLPVDTQPLPYQYTPFGELTKEQVKAAEDYVRQAYNAAKSAHEEPLAVAKRIRDFAAMKAKREVRTADGQNAPAGTPNITSALLASRIRGLGSNAEAALMRSSPFFSASPHSASAQATVRPYEAKMEAHLRTTDGFNEIKKSIWDATTVHMAVLKSELVRPSDTSKKPTIRTRFVPLEDFMCFPTNTVQLKNTATFERVRTVYGVLRGYAADNYYDAEAVAAMGETPPEPSPTQAAVGSEDGTGWLHNTDLKPTEYWECFIRWDSNVDDPEAPPNAMLWQGCFDPDNQKLLRFEPADLPFDEPPYEILQPEEVANSVYSVPPAMLILDYQDINDALLNSIMAEAQYATAPVLLTGNRQFFDDYTNGQIAPGKAYYVPGGTTEDNVKPLQFRLNPATFEARQVVMQEAGDAFPANPSLPPGTRQVTTAINLWAQGTGARLSSIISSIKSGLERYARKLWMMIRAYELSEPTPVFSGGVAGKPSQEMYLGPQQIEIKVPDLKAIDERLTAIQKLIEMQGIPYPVSAQLAQQINGMMGPEMDTLTIHSAFRDDISWRVTGGETAPDRVVKQESIQAMLQTIPIAASINPQHTARMIWEVLSRYYENLGIMDWKEILGEPPEQLDPAQAQQVVQQLQQFLAYQRSGVMSQPPQTK